MAHNWKTVNLEEEYYQELQKFIETREEYTSIKQFLKEAANEKREQLQNQEQQKLIETLELLLQNTELTKKEIQQIIKEKQK